MLIGLGSELDEIITARRLAVFGYAMLSSLVSLSLFVILVFKFILDSSRKNHEKDYSSQWKKYVKNNYDIHFPFFDV